MIGMAKFRKVRVKTANIFRIYFFSRGNPNSLFLFSDYSIDVLVFLVVWLLIQTVGVTNFIPF